MPDVATRIAAVADTLRYLAGSFVVDADDGPRRDSEMDYQSWMLDTAEDIERSQPEDWWCCPLCEEATCDDGCPLSSVRASVST